MAKRNAKAAAPKPGAAAATIVNPTAETSAIDVMTSTSTEVPTLAGQEAEMQAGAEDSPPNDEQAVSLMGTDKFPSQVVIAEGVEVPLGDVVRAAFTDSGATIEQWNDPEAADERDRLIGIVVDRLVAEHADKVATEAAAAEAEAAAAAAVASSSEPVTGPFVDYEFLSHADRNNPDKLQGKHLRELGYRLGLSWSEMGRYSDHKVREQIRYIAYRQYER